MPASHLDYQGLWKTGKLNDAVWTGFIFASFSTESINPLYSGSYAVGPYLGPPVALSGSPQTSVAFTLSPGGWQYPGALVQADAAGPCDAADEASESSPAATDPSGWWTGHICGMGQAVWRGVTIAAGHAWALETTALDEGGLATNSKMMPVLGVWSGSDPGGTTPTVAAASVPLNANATGTTLLQGVAHAADESLRLAIADSRMQGKAGFRVPRARAVCRDGRPGKGQRRWRSHYDYGHRLSRGQSRAGERRGSYRDRMDPNHRYGYAAGDGERERHGRRSC